MLDEIRIKYLVILFHVIMCSLFSDNIWANEIVHNSHKIYGIVPGNNDFDPNTKAAGKIVEIPAVVENKINGIIQSAYSEWSNTCISEEGDNSIECKETVDDFYGPVIRLSAYGELELYIFEIKYLFSNFYGFILYNPTENIITDSPPQIYGKWMEGDWGGNLKKPIVSFDNNIGNGKYKLIIKERVHNGTMYNAVMCRYYAIADNLSLIPILNIETELLDLYTEKEHGVIHRNVKRKSQKELLLTVVLNIRGKDPLAVGEAVLRQDDELSPFRIVSRKVFINKYDKLLLTGSEEEETAILQRGYNLYY